MIGKYLRYAALVCLAWHSGRAATLGTVIPVRGELADIAIDKQRNVVYAANFTANHVEVLSISSLTFGDPINVPAQPSALAISPDNQYLVVGHYASGTPPSSQGITIINLNTGAQRRVSLGTDSVLAVAFGNSPSALIVTTSAVSLLDPSTGTLSPLALGGLTSGTIPVPWATAPAAIITGTAGVSGDGNMLFALIDNGGTSSIIRYSVSDGTLVDVGEVTSPALGPRSLSIDQTGATFLAGWALLTVRANALALLAQLPYANGVLSIGAHAFDPANKLIYGQVPPATGSASHQLQIFDSDNLTVRDTFQLQEDFAGRALLNGSSMYAISNSGITVLPMAALSSVHRVAATQEDLFFQSSGCNQGVLTQSIDIVDPGGNATQFALKPSSPGVTLSAYSGTTPARIQVFVDPTVFQAQKGTSIAQIQISSGAAVNVPSPVRVLVNTKNPDQKGSIYNVPGTVVDVLPDPSRDQFYVLRQDRNQVIAFNGTTMAQIGVMRTGNTPIQMAIISDHLLVTNDNSQLINVFDLSTLTASAPIFLPAGHYAHSIAAGNGVVLTNSRSIDPKYPTGAILNVDFTFRIANVTNTTIFNNVVPPGSALSASPSGQSIFLAMPDGTVAVYDTFSRTFVASRKDVSGLSGAYAALSDDLYMAGNNVFNTALVPIGTLDLLGGVSSGAIVANGKGLLSSTPAASVNGVIQRYNMNQLAPISPALTSEAPKLTATLSSTPPTGQTGQTILPFTRTLAALSNLQSFVQLSTSGFTLIPANYDDPAQFPVVSAATNAADQTKIMAPGGLVTIWGSGLSDGTAVASSLPLTSGLNNVCVYASGTPVPLLFVSPNQINAQLPFGLPSGASLVVSTAGGASSPFPLSTQTTAPAIFRAPDGTPMIIRTVDGKMITNSTPIHLNETLIIYMTGLGPVSNSVGAGAAGPASPLAATTINTSVYIGGSQLFTLWSGLAPGFVGVYQVNAQVPFHNVPTGDNIPFTVISGNAQTQVKVSVQQ